jgi:hypothetical protein
MMVKHARILADGVCFERALLCRDAIDMHRAIAALSGDVFVQGIPGDPLNVVVMLCDFMYAFS